jgi:hypothetical protein
LVTDAKGRAGLRWKSTREIVRARAPIRTISDPSVLDDFVALAEAPPERVLRFVRKYGMLGLCKRHGLPSSHDSSPGRIVICGTRQPEDVALYNRYAKEVRAILRLAAAAHEGLAGRLEDWRDLGAEDLDRTAKHARLLVTRAVGSWLAYGDVRASFDWTRDAPQVQLEGNGTWGAIARQLAFAIARAERLAICAGCGARFTGRVQTGRQSWCQACGKKAADRESKRRQRARLRRLVRRS